MFEELESINERPEPLQFYTGGSFGDGQFWGQNLANE